MPSDKSEQWTGALLAQRQFTCFTLDPWAGGEPVPPEQMADHDLGYRKRQKRAPH
jgi:hypothetical protein